MNDARPESGEAEGQYLLNSEPDKDARQIIADLIMSSAKTPTEAPDPRATIIAEKFDVPRLIAPLVGTRLFGIVLALSATKDHPAPLDMRRVSAILSAGAAVHAEPIATEVVQAAAASTNPMAIDGFLGNLKKAIWAEMEFCARHSEQFVILSLRLLDCGLTDAKARANFSRLKGLQAVSLLGLKDHDIDPVGPRMLEVNEISDLSGATEKSVVQARSKARRKLKIGRGSK